MRVQAARSETASELRTLVSRGDVGAVTAKLSAGKNRERKEEREEDAKSGLEAPGQDGMTLMHIAAERGDIGMLKALHKVAGLSLSILDIRGGEPILEAAASGKLECIKWLVSNGVNVNTSDNRGDTALHLASGFGHTETLKWLLANGANVSSRTRINVTPLLYATAKGRLEEIKLLFAAGADAWAQDDERGWNSAHTAAGCNQADAVRLLAKLVPGIMTSRTGSDDKGLTPLQVAKEAQCPESYLACAEILKSGLQTRSKSASQVGKSKKAQVSEKKQEILILDEERSRIAQELLQMEEREKSKQQPKKAMKKKCNNNTTNKKEASKAQTHRRPSVASRVSEGNEEKSEQGGELDEQSIQRAEKCAFEIDAEQVQSLNRPADIIDNMDSGWEIKVSRKKKQHRDRSSSANIPALSIPSGGSKSAAPVSLGLSVDISLARGVSEEAVSVATPPGSAFPLEDGPMAESAKQEFATSPSRQMSPSKRNMSPGKRGTSRWTLGHSVSEVIAETCEPAPAGQGQNGETSSTVGLTIQLPNESVLEVASGSGGVSKSRLCPHAPPWSPRRRRWTSQAANAGQMKVPETKPPPTSESMDSEFQRMLKKFVHMDSGARTMAKRKFAKASADYEEKRLADAEEMEQSWRTSVKARLRRGIENTAFSALFAVLREVEAAEEARKLHEMPMTGELLVAAREDEAVIDDAELSRLMEHARAVLVEKDHSPLDRVSTPWKTGVLVIAPDDLDGEDRVGQTHEKDYYNGELEQRVAREQFERQLRHSVESWRFRDKYRSVWLRFSKEQSHLILAAVHTGFDFEHARPGYVIMKYTYDVQPQETRTSMEDEVVQEKFIDAQCTLNASESSPPSQVSTMASQVSAESTADVSGLQIHLLVLRNCSKGTKRKVLLQRQRDSTAAESSKQKWVLPFHRVLDGETPETAARALFKDSCGSDARLEQITPTLYYASLPASKAIVTRIEADYSLAWKSESRLRDLLHVDQLQACDKHLSVPSGPESPQSASSSEASAAAEAASEVAANRKKHTIA